MSTSPLKNEHESGVTQEYQLATDFHNNILDDMTDDQIQAMTEFGDMRIDFGLPAHDAPVYDVADRVRILNEQLAQQVAQSAAEEAGRSPRRRSIKFKETLVDLEIPPPPDYHEAGGQARSDSDSDSVDCNDGAVDRVRFIDTPSALSPPPTCGSFDSDADTDNDDDDDDDGVADLEAPFETKRAISTADGISDSSGIDELDGRVDDTPLRRALPSPRSPGGIDDYEFARRPKTAPHRRSVEFESTPRRKEEQALREADDNTNDNNNNHSLSNIEKQVLIERNGNFSLVDISSLTAEEKVLYGVDINEEEFNSLKIPSPPTSQRPASAPSCRRPQSAYNSTQNERINGASYTDNYHSPYAMDPQAKRDLTRRKRIEERQKKNEAQERENKLERSRDDADQAFEHWLKVKQTSLEVEAKDRRYKQIEMEIKTKKEKEDRNNNWFNIWMREKRKELKEKKIKEKQIQIIIEDTNRKSAEENLRSKNAYRNWIKNKNSQLREAHFCQHKLLKRRSRKCNSSKFSAKSRNQQQYVDYYGYSPNPATSYTLPF